MSPGEPWRLGHRPGLDGLRGVAILLVMVAHVNPDSRWGAGGSAGVTMFFTLSGFLITALLIGERTRSGRNRLGAFYLRRALRLFPALVVMVAAITTLDLFVDHEFATPRDAALALSYVSNWFIAYGITDAGILSHTWSLAIEEQFYLLWPVVALLAFRSRHWRGILYAIAAGAWLYALVGRWVFWESVGPQRVYSGTDLRMDALLIGCALAVWMTSRSPSDRPRSAPQTDAVLLAGGVVLFGTAHPAMDYLLNPAWIPLLTAFLIYRVASGAYSGLLTGAAIRYVGRRSYGLYLWHGPVLGLVFMSPLPHWPAAVVVAYALAWIIVELSWRYVETPFLRLKNRQAEPVSTLPIAGSVGRHLIA